MRSTITIAPLALLVWPLTAAAAQLPAPTAATPATAQEAGDTAEDARDLWRVFTLEDGRVLRLRSRKGADGWQFREGRDWLALEGEPSRVRTVRSLLAEATAMERDLGPRDLERRVAVADWLVRQGLHPEAIERLDRVLAVDPGHRGAHRMIERTHIELDLPPEARANAASELKGLIRLGCASDGATREVAVRRIEDFHGRVDLHALVAAELGCPQFRRRAFGTLLARRLFPGEFLEALARRAILDGFGGVREGAAEALRETGDVAVLAPAIRALGSENANVRTHAAEALANLGHPAAVEPLASHLASTVQGAGGGPSGTRAHFYLGEQVAIVMDYDVEIAQAASIADPIVSVQDSGVMFDVRAQAQITQVVEMRTVVSSLQKLTGARPGRGVQDWLGWWDENADQWRSKDHLDHWTKGTPPGTGRTGVSRGE